MDVANLGFSVDSTGLVRGQKELGKLDKAGERAEKRAGSMGGAFRAIGGIFAAIGITQLAGDTFRAASSMEAMTASLKTVTGSALAANDALAVIKEFAATTPFQLEQSVQGFIKLKALGLDPSIEALRSYGNTASAMGKSLNQAVEAVADAVTGEFERLKEFGIKAKSEGDQVTFTFQGVATTVQKEAGAIEGYLRGIGDVNFAGAMSDQMGTLGGVLSNLKDSFFNLQVEFFKTSGIGDGLKGAMRSLSGAFARLGAAMRGETDSRMLNDLGAAFNFIMQAGKVLFDVIGFLVTGFYNLYEIGRPLLDLFSVSDLAIISPLNAVNDKTNLISDSFEFLQAVLYDTDIIMIALVEGFLVGFEKIKSFAKKAGEAVKLAFTAPFAIISDSFSSLVGLIGKGADAMGANGLAKDIELFSDKLGDILNPLDDYEKAIIDIDSESKEAIRQIKTITGLMAEEAQAAKLAAKTIRDVVEVKEDLVSTSERVIPVIEEETTAVEVLTEATMESAKETKEATTVMRDSWERFSDSAFSSLETFYRSGLSKGGDFVDSMKDLFKDMAAGILATITKLIASNAFKKLANYVTGGSSSTGLFDGLGSLLGGGKSGGDTLSSAANIGKAANAIKSIASGVGSGASGTGGLSGLARSIFGGGNTSAVGPVSPTSGMLGNIGTTISKGASAAWGGVKTAATFLKNGAMKLIGAIPGWGQALLAAAAVYALIGSNARSFDQIVKEDYLPDLLGAKSGQSAGNNSAATGANFGITGTGITSQLLVDGGENGNGGFFNGATKNLEEFGKLLQANGIKVDIAHGTLRALSTDNSKTAQDIKNLWQTYADGLTQVVEFSEVFKTATENNLIKPSNLLFENLALGFGQSYFEAKDALIGIDREFDLLVQGGASTSEALTKSFSDFYGITTAEANDFFNQSGVSIDQWSSNFSNASGDALASLLEFNNDGLTAFEQLNGGADSFRTNIQGLNGVLNTVDLGVANGRFNVPQIAQPAAVQGGGESALVVELRQLVDLQIAANNNAEFSRAANAGR